MDKWCIRWKVRGLETKTWLVVPTLKKKYSREHGLTDNFLGEQLFYMVSKQCCDRMTAVELPSMLHLSLTGTSSRKTADCTSVCMFKIVIIYVIVLVVRSLSPHV